MELELLTERLFLRPLRHDDLNLAIEMFTDPEVVRYVAGPGPQSAEEIEAGLRLLPGIPWSWFDYLTKREIQDNFPLRLPHKFVAKPSEFLR